MAQSNFILFMFAFINAIFKFYFINMFYLLLFMLQRISKGLSSPISFD